MKKFLITLAVVAIVGAGVAYACCAAPDPPTISADVDPGELWPPNHKMVDITLNVTVTNADYWKILSVVSDEPDNAEGAGDGNTDNDIVIGDDLQSLQLRAERCGNKADYDPDSNGRVYTIVIAAYGMGGMATTVETVTVPHDQKGGNQP